MMSCPNCGHSLVPQAEKRKGGKPPYGFLATSEGLEFAPHAGGLVLAWMMKANAQGYGIRGIALKANALTYPSPSGGTWSHGSVARVIRQGKKYSHLIPIEYVLGD